MRIPRGIIVGLSAVILFAGCEQVEDTFSEGELLTALRTLVEADEAFSTDDLSDGGLYDDDYDQDGSLGKALADTLWPGRFQGIRWGRTITERSWDLSFDEIGDDTVYATITGTIGGNFLVGGWVLGADSTIVIQDTVTKPFSLVTTRRVRFVKAAKTGDLLQDWRVDGLTAILGTAGSKVSLETVAFSLSDAGGTYFSLGRDELLSRFFDRQNLPRFKPLLPVAAFVTVDNSGPEFPLWSGERVVIRHGRSRSIHSRRGLNDLGLGIDAAALNHVYSGV